MPFDGRQPGDMPVLNLVDQIRDENAHLREQRDGLENQVNLLRAELAAAREALAFYAQHSTYRTSTVYASGKRAETAIERDSGELARKALRRRG